MNIYQTKEEKKNPIVMKACFSEEKLIKQLDPLPFLILSINPLFLSNFFMTLLFVQVLKIRTPPNFRGEETIVWL